jgi:hemoglobin-like flavoprotein
MAFDRRPGEMSMITSDDVRRVRESFALVIPIKEAAADLFYSRLFEIAPQVRGLFPQDLRDQKRKLMAMFATAVAGLHNLDRLVPAVKNLGARHVGYGAKAEHYAVVGEALLWTLERGLGEAFTPDVRQASTRVYSTLAAVMQAGAAELAELQAAE